MSERAVNLAGVSYEIGRLRLDGFLNLQVAQRKLFQGAKQDDTGAMAHALYLYLSTAIPHLPRIQFDLAPWHEVILAFNAVAEVNLFPEPGRFALLETGGEGTGAGVDSTPSWDYPERVLYSWVHTLAHAYGWSMDVIFNLWPEEAVALIQEIEAEKHRDFAMRHALSPVTYSTDKSGRVSYKPPDAPAWMSGGQHKKTNKLGRVSESMIPIGNVTPSPARKKI